MRSASSRGEEGGWRQSRDRVNLYLRFISKSAVHPIAAEFASAADTRASDEFIAENGDGPGVRLEEGSVGVRHALR